MIAVITFGRSASGVRAVRTPIIGPLTSGVKSVAAKSATITSHACAVSGSTQSGTANARIPNAASLQRRHAPDDEDGEDRPDERPGAERRVEEAGDPRALEVSYAKNASDADSAETMKPKPATVAVSGPSSPSRTTKRKPGEQASLRRARAAASASGRA